MGLPLKPPIYIFKEYLVTMVMVIQIAYIISDLLFTQTQQTEFGQDE